MHTRHRIRRAPRIGQPRPRGRRRTALILAVPVTSLVLPALAVAIASAGGSGQLTRSAAAIAQFLLFYSGVFALVALTAAVAAGLLATDRIVMTPERRILAQALHRTTSLIAMSALANHVMLEVLAHRAKIVDGFVPFMAARRTFYMGLGTLASDLFLVIIVTGVARRKFAAGARPRVWRGLHATAYAAWPLAVLHGLLAGRPAKPYVDWSYGCCLAAVLLALTVRSVVAIRGRNAAGPGRRTRTGAGGVHAAAALGQPAAALLAMPEPYRSPPPGARQRRALPAGGAVRPGYPDAGYPGGGYPDAGYPGGGYPDAGYPDAGYPGGGYPRGGHRGFLGSAFDGSDLAAGDLNRADFDSAEFDIVDTDVVWPVRGLDWPGGSAPGGDW